MPGIYKIGCTSRNPSERADELFTTGVPVPFIVEYYVYIDNYEFIEKQIHGSLSNCRYSGREFFENDLSNCIKELKKVASSYGSYGEKYNNDLLKAKIEGWERKYLEEQRIKKQKEEEQRKKYLEEQRIRKQKEEEERVIRQKKEEAERMIRQQEERWGCLVTIAILLIAIWIAKEGNSSVPFFIGLGLAIWVWIRIGKSDS